MNFCSIIQINVNLESILFLKNWFLKLNEFKRFLSFIMSIIPDEFDYIDINKEYPIPVKSLLSNDDDITYQDMLYQKTVFFTDIPQFVRDVMFQNRKDPSDMSIKLCKRLKSSRSTFQDFIEHFLNEVEERTTRKLSLKKEVFNGPICGIISSQLKEVLKMDSIENFLVSTPADIKKKFESELHPKQRSNIATIIQIFNALESKKIFERTFLVWISFHMCRITLNYNEIGCDENYKCITQVYGKEKKKRSSKKKEKIYWLLLGNGNELTICQNESQFQKEGAPIPVDLFSFTNKKGSMIQMNIHQFPKTIKMKFEVNLKDKAFDQSLWERGCLRVKKVPFFASLGYEKKPVYHPAYIEATTRAIMNPLSLVLRAIFSFDEEHDNTTITRPCDCYEVFKAFFNVYLYHKRPHEMIHVMVVEGLLTSIRWSDCAEGPQYLFPRAGIATFNQHRKNKEEEEDQNDENKIEEDSEKDKLQSFLTFFALFFLEQYSDNYFQKVIREHLIEIINTGSLAEKHINISLKLLKSFVNTIIQKKNEISPQIHHFATILQNFAVIHWGRKLELYKLLKEFFFDLYVYRMITDPRIWDNSFSVSNNNQTGREFLDLFDSLISPEVQFEERYPNFIDSIHAVRELQNKMFEFIMNLPVINGEVTYQEVNNDQQEGAVAYILTIISKNPILFRTLLDNKKTRLNQSPIIYSVANFIRCLISTKQNIGMLDDDDRELEEPFKDNSGESEYD